MKATFVSKQNRWNAERRLNPYLSQALERKRFWLSYSTEFELIGAQLRRLRLDKGYGIEWVAKAIRMPTARLFRIEQGAYMHFELCHLQRLSALYDTSPLAILSVIPYGLPEDTVD
jgi:hypothetical protein